MLKLAIGLVVAVIIGIACRWFGIPLPGPPAIMGAAMAVAMATGYTATDYLLTRDHRPVVNSAGVKAPATLTMTRQHSSTTGDVCQVENDLLP